MREWTSYGPRRPGILVVDDAPFLRDMLGQALPLEGFAVWAAPGATEAALALARHLGEIDVALVDLRLPGLDGPDTVAALRQVKPGQAGGCPAA